MVQSLPDRICPYCREAFTAAHGNQKYCSPACKVDSNRVRHTEYMRGWRSGKGEGVREKQRGYDKKYYRTHLDRLQSEKRESSRRYHHANPEKARAKNAARNRGAPFTETAKEYVRLILADPCSYCGREVAEIDHIVPISTGGKSDWDNLAPACGRCNGSKGARSLLFFMLSRRAE